MFFTLVLGATTSYGQAQRDDRTNKQDPKRGSAEEKTKQEFNKLPADKKTAATDSVKTKAKGKETKKDSASTKSFAPPAPTVTKKEAPAPKKEVPAPKKDSGDGKLKPDLIPQPNPVIEPEKADSAKPAMVLPSSSAPKEPVKTDAAQKAKDKKALAAKKAADKNGKGKKEEEVKPLPPKVQKKPKSKIKYSEEQLKEFSLYTERISSNPDSADVAVMLPKSGGKINNDVRLKKAVELIENHFPDKALSLLNELVSKEASNANYKYWLGRAYLESYNNRDKAVSYLIYAAAHTAYSYQDRAIEKNTLAPINALYYLGLAYNLDGDLAQAERHYRLFIQVAKPTDPLKPQAELRILQLANAEKMVKKPKKNVSVTNLGAGVNSPYADYSPYVTIDGTELFFTTARPNNDASAETTTAIDAENGKYFDDIYIADLNLKGEWEGAKPINLDSAGNEVVRGVSGNTKTLWLYQDNAATADLYESNFAFDSWQAPTVISRENTIPWGRNFNIDADRSIIYFASKDLGGYGGMDIFFSYKNEDGSWSEPRNVGPNVNTIYDEDMPYLHPNKRVLYYSSNSTRSMGGFDVFRSMLVGEWQAGENMGYPINTVEDDLYFSLAPDGKSAFYSRKGRDSKGDLDIYQINFFSNTAAMPPRLQASFKVELKKAPVVKKGKKPKVKKDEVEEPEDNNEIVLTNVLTKEQFVYIPNIRTGNFSVYLDPCTKYNVEYRKNGQPIRTEDFVAPCDMQGNNSTMFFDPLGTNTPTSPRASNMPLVDKTEANLQGYSWQLQRSGVPETNMSYQDISYLDSKGNILRSVKLDSEGIFQFEDIPGDQDYIFEIKLPANVCSQYQVVLMKDRKKVPGGATYSVICYQ